MVALSSRARIVGNCSIIHSPSALFVVVVVVVAAVVEWRVGRAHQFHSLGQDQSTVAQRTETIVAECSLTSCLSADRFPHYVCGMVSPLRLRWVKGVCEFTYNLPPTLFEK